jgi:hypothetical protein
VTDQSAATTASAPAAPLPVPGGSGLLAVVLAGIAAVGLVRFVGRLLGLAVLLGVVLATVGALVGGIAFLRVLLG